MKQVMYEKFDNVGRLVGELDRQRRTKMDIIISTASIEAVADEKGVSLRFPLPESMLDPTEDLGVMRAFRLTDWAHKQLALKCGIPQKYYEACADTGRNQLLADSINSWLIKTEKRLIRIQDGMVYAILSDRYKIIDNYPIVVEALLKFQELSRSGSPVEIKRCDLSETKMYIKAVVPNISAEVGKNDIHQAGIIISNSEVGNGALRITPFLWRLACSNGMIGENPTARIHLGRKQDEGSMVFSDSTKALQADTLRAEIRDLIDATFNPEVFEAWIDDLKGTTQTAIAAPKEALENVVKFYDLPKDALDDLLNGFIREADPTHFGLMQTLTSVAQGLPNYEDQIRFEEVAGELSAMDADRFKKLIKA